MFWRLCVQQLKTVCQQSLVKVPEFQTIKRHRRHNELRKMSDLLQPPSEVRGMLKLERERFKKTIQVPVLRLDAEAAHKLMPKVSKFYLKMKCLPPVRHPEGDSKHFELLLHPKLVTSFESLPIEELSNYNVTAENLSFQDLELKYENWRADEILGAVLPPADAVGSYSFVGHIVHVNIRDHLTEYKHLIGEVLLDKVARCRTVVNKSAIIENTFRNFQLELLAGEPDYQVSAKENGCHFEFDYSLVYWNPRLSTEHQRIRDLLNPGDILYDCFAGVGPFSVPAAQKLCIVKANDLNPESVRWLKYNLKRNKCKGHYEVFNKDGRQFILEDIREDLLARWQFIRDRRPIYDIHITMNLPAIAVEFLDAFRGLLMNEPEAEKLRWEHLNYPLVHVYCFFKGDSEETTMKMAMTAVDEHVGMVVKNKRVHYVRNVAPNKDMYRVTFPLSKEILMTAKGEKTEATSAAEEPQAAAGSTQSEVKMTEETPKSASASEATEKPTPTASSNEEEPQPAKRTADEAEQPPAKLQKQST